MAKSALQVYFLKSRGASFRELRDEISRAVAIAKNNAEKLQEKPAIVILASEDSLKYRFNIRQDAVMRHIGKIQSSLPSDIWIAVAFNALLRDGIDGMNTGFLLTRDSALSMEKKAYTPMEYDAMRGFYKGYSRLRRHWWSRFPLQFLEYSKVWGNIWSGLRDYPAIRAPSGLQIELRVCVDVLAPPFQMAGGKDAATVVCAWGLKSSSEGELVRSRKIVVINDSEETSPPARPAKGWSIAEGGIPVLTYSA